MKKLTLALPLVLSMCAPAYAGAHYGDDYPFAPSLPIPEVFVHPNTVLNASGKSVTVGWTLLYVNQNTFEAETGDSVEVVTPSGETARIAWTYDRTDNAPCVGEEAAPEEDCADTITITVTPPGFIAIPDVETVNEGDRLEVLIVPEVMG